MLRSRLALALALAAALPIGAQAQNPPRPVARAAGFASLGPLATLVAPGTSGPWTVRDAAGQAVLANQTAPGAVRFYTTDWQGDLAAGRSVSLKVQIKGSAPLSAAGLLFRLTNDNPRWVAFVEGADGKLGVYVRTADKLSLEGAYDIPGGHRPEGDVLSINQRGNRVQFLANGLLVNEPDSSRLAFNIQAPAGIVAMGQGEFTLGNFAFGRFIAPAAPPPPPAPPVTAGNDDTVAPPPPPPTPPAPRTVEVASLGPLGHNIRIGDNSKWLISVEDGAIVFNHSADSDLYYFNRSIPWTGKAADRAATVTVASAATSDDSGGGLLFGLAADGKAFWELLATGDGKIKLFHLKNNEFNLEDTFDPPNPGAPSLILKIAQTGDTMTMFVDGKRLTDIAAGEPDGFDPDGRVGVSMRGNGRFAFRDFAFGGASPPPPPPVVQAPVLQPPVVQAPRLPDPAPRPPVQSPVQPPVAPATPQVVNVDSLGPIGQDIKLGTQGNWTTSLQAGALVYANRGDEPGYVYNTDEWPTSADAGRSATVTVQVSAVAEDSAAGLALGVWPGGAPFALFAASGDGKARVFVIEAGAANLLYTFPMQPTAGNRHKLAVSQTGYAVTLYVDGKMVRTIPLSGELGDMDKGIGIAAINKGQFTFRDFAFGPAIPAATEPPLTAPQSAPQTAPTLSIPNLTPPRRP